MAIEHKLGAGQYSENRKQSQSCYECKRIFLGKQSTTMFTEIQHKDDCNWIAILSNGLGHLDHLSDAWIWNSVYTAIPGNNIF